MHSSNARARTRALCLIFPGSGARLRAPTARSRASLTLLASLALAAGCAGDDASDPHSQSVGAAEGTADAAVQEGDDQLPPGDAVNGASVAQLQACSSCHTPDYSGTGYYPNITQDQDTGIGSWDDQELVAALVEGVDPEGNRLCSLMPRLKLSDGDVADLVAYLRTIPAVDKDNEESCPGGGR
jgi:mono/diheme cytochrome c family protein